MSGVMEIFDKYRPQNKDAKVSLSGDIRDWAWFRIHAFTNTKINLIKGLQILNNLLAKHEANSYEEFLVCLEEFPFRLNHLLVLFQGKKNLKQCLLT